MILLLSVLIHINNYHYNLNKFQSLLSLICGFFKSLSSLVFFVCVLFVYIDFVSVEKPEKQLRNQEEADVRGNERKKKNHTLTLMD